MRHDHCAWRGKQKPPAREERAAEFAVTPPMPLRGDRRPPARYQIAGNAARKRLALRRLTERHHMGCTATLEAHRRMTDRLLAHGRELREGV